MKKRHIAVFTPPFAGHVYPALGLCSELVSRGHRVSYPTNPRFSARTLEAGVEVVEFDIPEIHHAEKILQDTSSDGSGYWRTVTLSSPLTLMRAAATVAELGNFYATNPPDVILYDWFAFAGRILARQLGCPAIQVHSHFAHHPDSLMRVDGISTNPAPMVAFGELLDAFMSTYGFERKHHLWHFEKVNIFLIPREFQYDSDSFDSRFKFVGAIHNRNVRPAVWQNNAENGKPLLLITENTASMDGRFLKLCVEAFGDSQYHVVFSKGLNSPEVSSDLLPRNFDINREAFNCEILPFANVMVCQGSMGSTLESLHHGVPVVAVPSQPYNAEVSYRLAELGLGLNIPERGITSSVLRKAVDTAYSDKALLERVKRMQDLLQSSPGAKAAADVVEESLALPSDASVYRINSI